MRRFNSIDHKLKQIPHRIDRLTIETIEFIGNLTTYAPENQNSLMAYQY